MISRINEHLKHSRIFIIILILFLAFTTIGCTTTNPATPATDTGVNQPPTESGVVNATATPTPTVTKTSGEIVMPEPTPYQAYVHPEPKFREDETPLKPVALDGDYIVFEEFGYFDVPRSLDLTNGDVLEITLVGKAGDYIRRMKFSLIETATNKDHRVYDIVVSAQDLEHRYKLAISSDSLNPRRDSAMIGAITKDDAVVIKVKKLK